MKIHNHAFVIGVTLCALWSTGCGKQESKADIVVEWDGKAMTSQEVEVHLADLLQSNPEIDIIDPKIIIEADTTIDYKILVVKPNPNIDYKMRIVPSPTGKEITGTKDLEEELSKILEKHSSKNSPKETKR